MWILGIRGSVVPTGLRAVTSFQVRVPTTALAFPSTRQICFASDNSILDTESRLSTDGHNPRPKRTTP